MGGEGHQIKKKGVGFMKLSIRNKLIAYFMLAVLAATIISGALVNVRVKGMLETNIKLTSQQTLTESLANFQTYLKTLSIPVDLLTRKNEAKKLETTGVFEDNVKAVQDSLVASLKVVDDSVRCYYSTATLYHMNAYLYFDEESGKTKSKKTLEEGIDNTSKEWYTMSIDAPKRKSVFATFTEPYMDAETGEMIFTVSQAAEVDNAVVGVAAMDIKFSAIENYIQGLKLMNTGYVLLADADGNILVDDEADTCFDGTVADFSFWNSFLSDVETTEGACSYTENIGGKSYYITLLEDEITGWKLIGVIRSDVENADNMSGLLGSIGIGTVAGLIIGAIIALVVALSLSKAIKKLKTATEKLAEGDFSGRIDVVRKDELGNLQENFNSMVDSVSGLIKAVGDKFEDVYQVAGNISEVSSNTKETTTQVTQAIQSVAIGATEQAQSTQEANTEVDKLAGSLEETREYVDSINQMSKETNDLSLQGMDVVGELIEKSDKARENSKLSSNMIGEMLISIDKINYISDAIADITSQTNLLSLNASIQAARAGDVGKGFAVVADEIRKLADQSKESTDEIKAIINEISNKSSEVSKNLEESGKLQAEQEKAIDDTRALFGSISESIDNLIKGLIRIGELNENMNKNKETVVESMEHIASISEESAAAAEQVTASADLVNTTMEDVSDYAHQLNAIASELKEKISQFKL